jgi:hypothetical protein
MVRAKAFLAAVVLVELASSHDLPLSVRAEQAARG